MNATFRCLLACALTVMAASPAAAASTPAAPNGAAARNDYANARFVDALNAGMKHFYAREFKESQDDFSHALAVVPDNTLAISFIDAAADQAGTLDSLVNVQEDAVAKSPKNYDNHVLLGFAYLFQSEIRPTRAQDARDEFNAALRLDPDRAAAHVGLGIMRFNERSANRAKVEFQTALNADSSEVLAREYLGQIYQSDLQDPERGLAFVIGIPNAVPQYADAWFHVGSMLFDLHQNAAALKNLNKALELDPGHVGEAGQYGLTLAARAYLALGDSVNAKKMLQSAIDANVDTVYAKTLLSKIASDSAAKEKKS